MNFNRYTEEFLMSILCNKRHKSLESPLTGPVEEILGSRLDHRSAGSNCDSSLRIPREFRTAGRQLGQRKYNGLAHLVDQYNEVLEQVAAAKQAAQNSRAASKQEAKLI